MKNTTETTNYEKFLASEKSNFLAEAYTKYENDVSYEQHKIDANNQKTPVWKEINCNTDAVVEVGQQLSFNIYDTEIEHPESIVDYTLTVARDYNGKISRKTYSKDKNSIAIIDNEETRITNFAYINGQSIELTDEQIEYLKEESIFKS
ncbi:hypothetical protein BFR40_00490 [Brochothrix thermosphacta]|uniref:hypothetical protein n=1 Tax=Brochothrix thermosphacta TaxID=2756 RepID=UPI00083F52D2|nr:hypothetical protein [Brochothrix thermosphacta]ODJ53129.1 hypothetical protein BFR40_00490 [Brochothrix thermosphacta]